MDKKTKNKMAKATRLEVEAIDRKLEELRELKREMVTKINNEIKELSNRKRELKDKCKRAPSWDEQTPMTKLIYPSQIDRLREMLKVWSKFTAEEIVPHKTTRFEFNTSRKRKIYNALLKAVYCDIRVFRISDRQLYFYLEKHSNLGTASAIKKVLERAFKQSGVKNLRKHPHRGKGSEIKGSSHI